jgi:ubiquinone/menaquinone biosynthesis C-methylase UbiE
MVVYTHQHTTESYQHSNMTQFTLSSAVYVPSGARNRETFIEDTPQEAAYPLTMYTAAAEADEFDDLYDISEGEEEVFDFPISFAASPVLSRNNSSEKSSMTMKNLVFPEPNAWPTPIKQQHVNVSFDRGMLSPPMSTPQAELTRIAKRSSVYSVDAPSLDDSYTSEMELSCPSTPDIESKKNRRDEVDEDWSMPAQLNPASLMTLSRLTISVDEAAEGNQGEMREVDGVTLPRLNTNNLLSVNTGFESGELSALSIPSPGGFFSQLDSDARNNWLPTPHQEQQHELPSSVAESFYSRPFDHKPAPIDIVVEDTNETEGPPTARQAPPLPQWALPPTPGRLDAPALKSPNYLSEMLNYRENYENERYGERLQQQAHENFDRTSTWLASQDVDPDSFHMDTDDEVLPSDSISVVNGRDEEEELQRRHVVEELETPIEEHEKDDVLFQGFSHLQTAKGASDAFVHRKARTEKLRLDRRCLFSNHVNQLEGQYNLISPPSKTPQPVTARRVVDGQMSTIIEDDGREKLMIATAKREQDCLEQITPQAWAVEATKYLNGGTLLTSPVRGVFAIPNRKDSRVLDLGGAISCDWSWQVALEYPHVEVHAIGTASGPKFDFRRMSTPRNHKIHVVSSLNKLPFPDNHFDCISARNLYALLRNQKIPRFAGQDEYDLCLSECLRVLRPGGYLEFAVLDAEILNAGRKGQALSAEFCSNLRTRGYDMAATKSWLPRLRKLGFGHTRRAWLVLPMSQQNFQGGSTAEASHITGMVGSWAWERWMLKLQREMGRDEGALLDGVAGALEEGAKTGASWRYLSGWAQKPY